MVSHPAKYRWSSYRANAQGEIDKLFSPHSLYQALGNDDIARQTIKNSFALSWILI